MSQSPQVITVRWDETGEEHMQKLHDIQEGRGRVDWAAVKMAFRADLVEIKDEGTPELLKTGDREGLTRASFQPGSAILVSVSRKSQGHPINAFRAEILDALNESNKLTALALHAAFSRRPSSTSTRAKGRYRQNALVAYEGTRAPNSVHDMITGEELAVKEAIAVHIYRQRWPGILLRNLGGMCKHDARNIVLTRKEVAAKFDKGHICFMPQDDGSIQLKVLRKPMLAPKGDEQYVIKGNRDLKWACTDGRRLTSRTGALPAKRDAELDGVLEEGEVVLSQAACNRTRVDDGLLQQFLSASGTWRPEAEETDTSSSGPQTPRDHQEI